MNKNKIQENGHIGQYLQMIQSPAQTTPRESVDKLLEPIKEFSKFIGYKLNL